MLRRNVPFHVTSRSHSKNGCHAQTYMNNFTNFKIHVSSIWPRVIVGSWMALAFLLHVELGKR